MKALLGRLQNRLSRWLSGTATGLEGGQHFACPVQLPWGRRFDLVLEVGTEDPITQAYVSGELVNNHLIDLLLRFTKPGACVLDLGAHVGTFGLSAAALGYRVIAVEAAPRQADLLQR